MLGELAALISALCATASASLYKKGMQETGPLYANVVRICATTPIILLSLFPMGRALAYISMPAEAVALTALSGLAGLVVGDTFYMLSMRSIGIARTVPITFTYPLFTTGAALLILREVFTLNMMVGTALVVSGLLLLTSGASASVAPYRWKGVVAALMAAFLWATSITLMTIAVKIVDPFTGTAMRLTVACLVFACFLPLRGKVGVVWKIPRLTWASMALGGVLAQIIGFSLLGYSLASIGAARAVPLSSLSPLFSVAAGLALFRESISWRVVLGALVSVSGTILVTLG